MKIEKFLAWRLASIFCFLFFLFQISFLSLSQIAHADLLSDQEGLTTDIGPKAFNSTGVPTDIRMVVANVIRVFLGLLGIVFVALIVLAGYKWMMAQGEESKVTEAKEQLRTSIIGLAIILAAWGVTIFVFNSVLRATDPNFSIWGL